MFADELWYHQKYNSALECLFRIKEIDSCIERLRNKKISIFRKKARRINSNAISRLQDERIFLLDKVIKSLGGDCLICRI